MTADATTPAAILIAEDDPDDLYLMQRALRELSPQLPVAAARDGLALMAHLAACQPTSLPQLLVMDLNMPLMDGREVLRCLQGEPRYAVLPVVVLTTSVAPEDFRFTAAHGATETLSKPESYRELVRELGRLLQRYVALPSPGTAPGVLP